MIDMSKLETINKKLDGKSPEEIIGWAVDFLGESNIALSSSLSLEDQVLVDILQKNWRGIGIFTLDTGKLPKETYDLIKKTNERYKINIELLIPNAERVKEMVEEYGETLFYNSLELRKKCCHIRKVVPLKRKLNTLRAWITGLRMEQSVTRGELKAIEWDETFELVKINPLASWAEDQVQEYIKKNDVPYNELYDKGYKSIGCDPCSRAVKTEEPARSGRWWWEEPDKKECGLHIKNGKVERKQ